MTWIWHDGDGKWARLPSVHDAKKHSRETAMAMIAAISVASNPQPAAPAEPPPPKPEAFAPNTFGDALNRWKRRRYESKRAIGENSKGTYSSWLKNLEEWHLDDSRLAINVALDHIKEGDCEDLQDEYCDRPPTANKLMWMVRSIYRSAIGKEMTFRNPAIAITALPMDPYQPILLPEHFDRLYPVLLEISKTNPAAYPLLLAAITGARCTEATHISPQEIDRKTGNWTIPKTRMKTKRAHTFRLKHPEHIRIANSAAAWRTDLDKISAVRNLYRKLVKELDLPASGVHALRRHRGTVIALKYGIEVAAAQLGHSDTKITSRYVKVWGDRLDAVAIDIAADLERFHA